MRQQGINVPKVIERASIELADFRITDLERMSPRRWFGTLKCRRYCPERDETELSLMLWIFTKFEDGVENVFFAALFGEFPPSAEPWLTYHAKRARTKAVKPADVLVYHGADVLHLQAGVGMGIPLSKAKRLKDAHPPQAECDEFVKLCEEIFPKLVRASQKSMKIWEKYLTIN